MSLQLALNNALSGLNVNKQSLAVLSQNIANANNPNYSRKVVDQSAVYIQGNGSGVNVESVSRKVDEYLNQAIQLQQGAVGKASVISSYTDRVQNLLGTPGGANALDSYVTSFFTSMQSLAETPESSALRLNAVNSGAALARSISGMASSLQELRFNADQDISAAIRSVNADVRELYTVNMQISNAYNLGQSQGELLDKRDQLTRNIAQNLDVNLFYKADGTVQLFAGGSQPLLDSSVYELSYTAASSMDSFTGDQPLSAIYATRLDPTGKPTGTARELVPGGPSSTLVPTLTTGKIRGLMELRDKEFPALIDQLDMMAAGVRDQFNAVHNLGTGYPGATALTGTRAVKAGDFTQWDGSVRIALTDVNGQPLPSPYANQTSGVLPLTLDLSTLDAGTGEGAGKPTMQSIVDEINRYYGAPQAKASVGNISNIQLTSDSVNIPGSPAVFNFDFDLQNISGVDADFFVTGVRVLDDTNTDITNVTSAIPSVSLAAGTGFSTTNLSNTVTITTAAAHGFTEGQRIYLSDQGGTINGIPSSAVSGYFTITNVTGTTFQITAGAAATSTGTAAATAKAFPPYDTIESGGQSRTKDAGLFSANLSGNPASTSYTIQAQVAVDDGNGNFKTATVTYRVNNNQGAQFNARFNPTAVTGQGTLVSPTTGSPYLKATMVDANGKELPKLPDGRYVQDTPGYLKIVTTSSDYYVSIDSMDSKQLGDPLAVPPKEGTNRGFSHFFELNNFFQSNSPTATGDTVKGSAMALALEERFVKNPNLVSTGTIAQSRAPSGSPTPYYTYERNVGDNSIIQKLAALKDARVLFQAAGGLATTTQTFTGYTGEILSFSASQANYASSGAKNAQALLDGFTERATAVSGVNMDEELANTVIYQNAYAASARIITVTNELFDKLLNAF